MKVQIQVLDARGVSEDQLERFQLRLEQLGAIDPAAVYWPKDNELSATFEITEEMLGQLLEPEADRLAA